MLGTWYSGYLKQHLTHSALTNYFSDICRSCHYNERPVWSTGAQIIACLYCLVIDCNNDHLSIDCLEYQKSTAALYMHCCHDLAFPNNEKQVLQDTYN